MPPAPLFIIPSPPGVRISQLPIESLYRIITQMNQVSPLSQNIGTDLIKNIDVILKRGMESLAFVLPDFRSFSTVDYVAYGYHIPMNHIYQDLTVCLAYLVGLFVIGYFFLRTREVAK